MSGRDEIEARAELDRADAEIGRCKVIWSEFLARERPDPLAPTQPEMSPEARAAGEALSAAQDRRREAWCRWVHAGAPAAHREVKEWEDRHAHLSPVAATELLDLRRVNYSDGSEGGVSGYDLEFEFAGRRWSYRAGYDGYSLRDAAGVTVRRPDGGDPELVRLWKSEGLLRTLTRRPEPEDRTGYHKGDTQPV